MSTFNFFFFLFAFIVTFVGTFLMIKDAIDTWKRIKKEEKYGFRHLL